MAVIKTNGLDTAKEPRHNIPPGFYEARLISYETGTAKSGNNMITWTFLTCKGEHKHYNAIDAGDNNSYLREVLDALGHPKEDYTTGFDPDKVVNKHCVINVEMEESERDGNVYSNPKIVKLYTKEKAKTYNYQKLDGSSDSVKSSGVSNDDNISDDDLPF